MSHPFGPTTASTATQTMSGSPLLTDVHRVHHDVHMQTTTLQSRGVRLHPKLWARIEREAKSLRLKPTDYLRRKVEDAFSFDPEVQDMHDAAPQKHTDSGEYEPQVSIRKVS